MNRKGGVEQMPLPPNVYSSLRVSPNGRELAFGTDDGKEAIVWIYDLSRTGVPRRLTFGGGNRFPIWSGDGQRVVFQSDREGDPGLYWQRADGTGTAERLTTPDKGTAHIPESWSARDRGILVQCGGGPECVVVDVLDLGKEGGAVWRRHGRRLRSTPSFRPMGDGWPTRCGPAIWPTCTSSPSRHGRQVSDHDGNGHHPVWLPDGKGLSYRSARTGRSWSASTPSRVSRSQSDARDRGGTTDGPQSRLKVLRHHAGWCRLPDSNCSVGISIRVRRRGRSRSSSTGLRS